MNDFTKEELEDIALCVDSFRIGSIRGESRYGNLHRKIQSLIDNYCEHVNSYIVLTDNNHDKI